MADEEWTPPSEAEMKVIEARRERQDKNQQNHGRLFIERLQNAGYHLSQMYRKYMNFCSTTSYISESILITRRLLF